MACGLKSSATVPVVIDVCLKKFVILSSNFFFFVQDLQKPDSQVADLEALSHFLRRFLNFLSFDLTDHSPMWVAGVSPPQAFPCGSRSNFSSLGETAP
jgi:hypothetical protein